MEKLKQRLQPLQLSAEQKTRILHKAMKPKQKFAFIPIIIPTFIALALLFIALTVMPSDAITNTTASSLFHQNALPTRHIVLFVISAVAIIAVYMLMRKTIKETKRWQTNALMQELYVLLVKLPFMIAVLALIIGTFLFGLFYFANDWYVEAMYMGVFYFVILWSFLYGIRNMERTACPHCGEIFTRRQIIVKMMMQYRERCHVCNKLIYVTKETKQQALVPFLWPIMPLWIGNFASIHESLVIIFGLLNIATFIVFYIPYMAKFTQENTDNEKLS